MEDSSDSEEQSDELELLNRSFTLKARFNPNDFDYFTSVVRSDEEKSNDSLYSPLRRSQQKKKTTVEDYITDRHREILKSEISQFEFSEMAINLLYKLCKAESNTSGSEALHINVQCVNFAVRFLCTLQFESSPASRINLTPPEVAHLKASLTELLVASFDKILTHPDLFIKIIHNGILPMLLRLLEDSTYKLSVRLQPKDESNHYENNPTRAADMEADEAADLIKYLFGISYCTIVFFYCLLMQHRSLDKIHNFTEQFKLFGDCHKGLVLKECISLILRIPTVDKTHSVMLVKKLLDLISRLVTAMKLVRSEAIHSASCSRTKHKMCRSKVSLMMQHHHDILGTSFCHAGNMGLSPVCCVATLYATLTTLLSDEVLTQYANLRSKLLRCMRVCGSCCCFSPQFLLDRVIRIIRTHHGMANLCFSVLEQTLYGELGALKLIQDVELVPCATCQRYFISEENIVKEILSSSSNQNRESRSRNSPYNYFYDEGISKNASEASENKAIWPFLSKYLPLLQIEDYSILHATMSHLLRMSVQCKEFIKHDLLFCILYPAFMASKKRYLVTSGEASYFVTLSCLNSFSSLLSCTAFAEEFIQRGGLTNILELMSLPEFSKQCCSILEITAIVEIFNMRNDSNVSMSLKMSPTALKPNELESLSSLQMLFKSLGDVTDKALKYFKLKMEEPVFYSLIDLSKEVDAPFNNVEEEESYRNDAGEDSNTDEKGYPLVLRKSRPIDITGKNRSHNNAVFDMQFSSLEQSMTHHIELLKNIWTFWRTCAALCLYCPLLRRYLVRQKIFRDSYKMLKLLLHCICFVPCTMAENKLLIKILESIISVNLAVSGESKFH